MRGQDSKDLVKDKGYCRTKTKQRSNLASLYRAISLLCTGYKLYKGLLLQNIGPVVTRNYHQVKLASPR